MDKIWIETLNRISALEERIGLIESLCQEPLSEIQEPGPELRTELRSEPGPEPESKTN